MGKRAEHCSAQSVKDLIISAFVELQHKYKEQFSAHWQNRKGATVVLDNTALFEAHSCRCSSIPYGGKFTSKCMLDTAVSATGLFQGSLWLVLRSDRDSR